MRSNERIDAFSKIYEEKIWGEEPRSGDGSRPEAALPYVKFLSEVISRYQISSILDIGHGDWAMWPRDYFKNIKYLGVDAAEGLSDEMQRTHGGGSIEFQHLDAISELPNGFDLVMCKDVVQHLPASDCINLLKSLVDSKVVLICSDIKNDSILGKLSRLRSSIAPRARLSALLKFESPFLSYGIPHNTEIQPGSWQSIDLREAPFNLRSLGFELIDSFEFNGSPHYGNLVRKRIYLLTPIKARNNG